MVSKEWQVRKGSDAPWLDAGSTPQEAYAAAAAMAEAHGGLSYVRHSGDYICRIEDGEPTRITKLRDLARVADSFVTAWSDSL